MTSTSLGEQEDYDTQSVAHMFGGHAGKEFLERVLQPILDGYCYWTPECSEAMLLMIGKAASVTLKLSGGLQQIPEKAAEGCKVLLDHTVKRVRREHNGECSIMVEGNGQTQTIQAAGVVCATTASEVSKIILGLSAKQRNFFSSVRYSSTALVAQTYKKERLLGDKGIAFPRQGKSILASVTVSPEPAGDKLTLGTVKAYSSGSVGKRVAVKQMAKSPRRLQTP